MMKQYLLATALLLTVNANAVEIPNVFQSGGTAKASEVNENFTVLKDALNALSASTEIKTTYNAEDFLPSSNIFTEFVFQDQFDSFNNSLKYEELVIVSDEGNGKRYQHLREPDTVSNPAAHDGIFTKLDFSLNSEGYFFKGRHQVSRQDFIDESNVVVDIYKTFSPGIMRFPSSFFIGQEFGYDSVSTEDKAGFGKNLITSETIYKGKILEIVDVDVPAGSFQGCLKVLQEHASSMQIRYFCPNVGVVKVVSSSSSTTSIKVLNEFYTGAEIQEFVDSIPDYVLN